MCHDDWRAALSGYSPKEKSGGVYSRLYCQILRRKGWSESQMEELHRRFASTRAVRRVHTDTQQS